MKLLHTADWHLNDRLGKIDRTDHLRRRVEAVAAICDREAIDVVLIAGDLFSERAEVSSRVNQVADSLRHLRKAFADFFARGGIILGVTGNHDQDGRVRPYLELARAGMDVAEPPRNRGDYFAPGKLYLFDSAFVGRVRDPREAFDLQFALLPFPNLGRMVTGDEAATTPAELYRPMSEKVANWVRSLPEGRGYDTGLRSVLVAHLHVTGADVGRGTFHVGEDSAMLLDPAELPTGFDYVALGHIHQHQCIREQSHVCYSGSLDRMDFGERDQVKGVVLVEIGPAGRRGDPTFVPIESTPMIEATVRNALTAGEELAAQVPDKSALVRVVVEPTAADATASVEIAIRDGSPNATTVRWQATAPLADATRIVPEGRGVRETVLDYLARRLPADDPRRDELTQLAIRFLDREGFR